MTDSKNAAGLQEKQTENDNAQRGDAHVQQFHNPAHAPVFSFAVTLACSILCACMPSVAVFFCLLLVLSSMAALVFVCEAKARKRSTAALDIISRGRFIAIVAAVALHPPLTLEQVVFFVGHPLAMLAGNAPPGLGAALTFSMLCAVQTGIALVLALETIPSRRATAFVLGIASILPSGMGRWLRTRITQADHRRNSRLEKEAA